MSKDITVEQLFSMVQEMRRQNAELRREHAESIERLERQNAESIERLGRQNAESVERLERQNAELRRESEEEQREFDEKQREHVEAEKKLERERAEKREKILREHAETKKKLERERAETKERLFRKYAGKSEKLEREQDEALKKEPCRAGEYNSKNATIPPKFDEEKNFIPPKKQLDNNVGEDISDNRAQRILQTCLSVCKSPCWISYALASSFVVAATILSMVFVDSVAEEVKIGVICGVPAGICIASIIVLAARTMREQRGGYGVV